MSMIEKMIDDLQEAKLVYRQAVVLVINEHLGTELKPCLGGCGRVLFPRGQWREIPQEYRSQMLEWLRDGYAYDRCTPCYRSAVRSEEISPVSRVRILPPEELAYLRKKNEQLHRKGKR